MEVEEKYLPLVQWDTLEDHKMDLDNPTSFRMKKLHISMTLLPNHFHSLW